MNGLVNLSALVGVLSAQLLGDDVAISGVSTDTRRVQAGDLFIALKGPNFDAHDFIQQARQSGAVAVVVDHQVDIDIPQLVVADTRLALGKVAQYNRGFFNGVLFAVTGSSGKTTVKEMLAAISSQRGTTLATQGNLNNDIGVPLTLLRLSSTDEFAVIEMGASGPDEIGYSVALAQPDVAILTNAFGAHLEGFGSLQGVVNAKAEIFSGLSQKGTAVVNLDDPHAPVWLEKLKKQPILTFSMHSSAADVYASNIQQQLSGCNQFVLNYRQQSIRVELALLGLHNVANALAAAAAALADNCSLTDVATGLGLCKAVAGRMCPTLLDETTLLIDDSYNANPDAVKAAIDTLVNLDGESVLVLGDMGELGEGEVEQHYQVGEYAAAQGVQRLFTCGKLSLATSDAYRAAGGKDGRNLSTKNDLVELLSSLPEIQRSVLVKGSRSASMDQVVTGLIEGRRNSCC
ncbi:MAG: UDP-N-acetylmuramoyl-tripeptide--D-alanyl-D-alanine ligase [Amphritea sp.]